MPSALDRFMARTRLQFPDGSVLSIGTLSCDDQIHQAVYLAYTPAGSSTPCMELELPPKSAEVIIRALQEHANEARFINGERMLEYPEPRAVPPPGIARRTRKPNRRKKKRGQSAAPPNSDPATSTSNPDPTEGPPSGR
jgi:hypothetical protein